MTSPRVSDSDAACYRVGKKVAEHAARDTVHPGQTVAHRCPAARWIWGTYRTGRCQGRQGEHREGRWGGGVSTGTPTWSLGQPSSQSSVRPFYIWHWSDGPDRGSFTYGIGRKGGHLGHLDRHWTHSQRYVTGAGDDLGRNSHRETDIEAR